MVENLSEVDVDAKFTELPRMRKEQLFYREAWDQERFEKEKFIRDAYNEGSRGVSEIVWLSDDMQLVKVYSHTRKGGERIREERWIAFVDKREIAHLMPDMEAAFLKALEVRHLKDANTRFVEFACKMLGKKLWDE